MTGKVYLVGAGPGDPGLITVKGAEFLENADVIVYDRLVNPSMLRGLKEDARLIYVGKSSKVHTKTQDEINEILYQEAILGNNVVRLKGGDPYVFGRGSEEGEYLFDRGVEFEVVPGITSAIGGLAYAGIPITHRGVATSFHVITGHLKDEDDELNWEALADLDGTLVFLMGVSNLENIVNNLMENGKSPNTPVAIITWGTTSKQSVVDGKLSNIHEIATKANIKPPSLIAVGDVVGRREKLNFFEKKPLLGKNLVVTREENAAASTIKRLESLGANVISFPTIKIEAIMPNMKLDKSIENIDLYQYIVFTSVNGVRVFFDRYFEMGKDIRDMAGIKLAAVGTKTQEAIEKYGIRVDLVPDKFVGEELVEVIVPILEMTDKVLIPRAKIARDIIVDELKKVSAADEVEVYDTLKTKKSKDEIVETLSELEDYDLLFTSSSTFTNFVEILEEEANHVFENGNIISIGPITTKTIVEAGHKVYKEADEYTIDGIIDILKKENRNA